MKRFIMNNIGISISFCGFALIFGAFIVWSFTRGLGLGVLAFAVTCALSGVPVQVVYDEYKRFRRD